MAAAQRIVSFLPSATEMACALGLGDRLMGITHECDYPPEVNGEADRCAQLSAHRNHDAGRDRCGGQRASEARAQPLSGRRSGRPRDRSGYHPDAGPLSGLRAVRKRSLAALESGFPTSRAFSGRRPKRSARFSTPCASSAKRPGVDAAADALIRDGRARLDGSPPRRAVSPAAPGLLHGMDGSDLLLRPLGAGDGPHRRRPG